MTHHGDLTSLLLFPETVFHRLRALMNDRGSDSKRESSYRRSVDSELRHGRSKPRLSVEPDRSDALWKAQLEEAFEPFNVVR